MGRGIRKKKEENIMGTLVTTGTGMSAEDKEHARKMKHKKRPFVPPTSTFANEARDARERKRRGAMSLEEEEEEREASRNVLVQLQAHDGTPTGPQISVPMKVGAEELDVLVNQLLDNSEKMPYSYYLNEEEIASNVYRTLRKQQEEERERELDSDDDEAVEAARAAGPLRVSTEKVLTIVYQPQAVFRVRTVTRCTSSLPGHKEPVLTVTFHPRGHLLATGSGDTTIRLWDMNTELPAHTLRGHRNWVLTLAFAPNGELLASGGMDNEVRVWDPAAGKKVGKPLRGHTKWITALSWEPVHRNPACKRLASSSKDGRVRVWNVRTGKCERVLSGHTATVSSVVWGGEGLLYSASHDRTIKVWSADDGKLVRTLGGHAHWVNHLALNVEFVLRTGAYDHTDGEWTGEEARARAKTRYEKAMQLCGGKERLVSASDDFTLMLWEPSESKKPLARMTGHQAQVNHVSFSPDGRYVGSASFDSSVKLWDGRSGKYVGVCRGHVGAVYHVAWAADSRMLVSSSKDSTLKLWDVRTQKLKGELPGHADEVFAASWSPDGARVASGGKDRMVKVWRH